MCVSCVCVCVCVCMCVCVRARVCPACAQQRVEYSEYCPRPEHSKPPAPLGQSTVSFRSVSPLASVSGVRAALCERGGRVPSPPKYFSTASGACKTSAYKLPLNCSGSSTEHRVPGLANGAQTTRQVLKATEALRKATFAHRQQLLHLDFSRRQCGRRWCACTGTRAHTLVQVLTGKMRRCDTT